MHQEQQRTKHAILFRLDLGKSRRSGHKTPPGALQMRVHVPTNANLTIKPGGVWYTSRLLYFKGWGRGGSRCACRTHKNLICPSNTTKYFLPFLKHSCVLRSNNDHHRATNTKSQSTV